MESEHTVYSICREIVSVSLQLYILFQNETRAPVGRLVKQRKRAQFPLRSRPALTCERPQKCLTKGTPRRQLMQRRSSQQRESLHGPLSIHNISCLFAATALKMDNGNESGSGSASEHARIALLTHISSRILRLIDTLQVAKFSKTCERFELEVDSKQTEMPSMFPICIGQSSILHY